jgi:hypothetical protein
MKKYVLTAAIAAVVAHAALADQLRIPVPEINRYYSDYNYVVAYSTPAERSLIARQAAEVRPEASLLKDNRLKTLYDMVKGLLACELDQDPSLIRGNRLAEDFLFAKIPVAVSAVTRDHVSVRTIRQAVRNGWQDSSSSNPGFRSHHFDPRRSNGFSYSETDYWIRFNGTWRISSLHFYLVGN